MNKELEFSLWEEWVMHLCHRESLMVPTSDEWRMLEARWYPNKMPIQTIDDLRMIRGEKQ